MMANTPEQKLIDYIKAGESSGKRMEDLLVPLLNMTDHIEALLGHLAELQEKSMSQGVDSQKAWENALKEYTREIKNRTDFGKMINLNKADKNISGFSKGINSQVARNYDRAVRNIQGLSKKITETEPKLTSAVSELNNSKKSMTAMKKSLAMSVQQTMRTAESLATFAQQLKEANEKIKGVKKDIRHNTPRTSSSNMWGHDYVDQYAKKNQKEQYTSDSDNRESQDRFILDLVSALEKSKLGRGALAVIGDAIKIATLMAAQMFPPQVRGAFVVASQALGTLATGGIVGKMLGAKNIVDNLGGLKGIKALGAEKVASIGKGATNLYKSTIGAETLPGIRLAAEDIFKTTFSKGATLEKIGESMSFWSNALTKASPALRAISKVAPWLSAGAFGLDTYNSAKKGDKLGMVLGTSGIVSSIVLGLSGTLAAVFGSPIAGVVAGIAGTVLAITTLTSLVHDNWGWFKDTFGGIAEWFRKTFMGAYNWLQGVGSNTKKAVKEKAIFAGNVVTGASSAIGGAVQQVSNVVTNSPTLSGNAKTIAKLLGGSRTVSTGSADSGRRGSTSYAPAIGGTRNTRGMNRDAVLRMVRSNPNYEAIPKSLMPNNEIHQDVPYLRKGMVSIASYLKGSVGNQMNITAATGTGSSVHHGNQHYYGNAMDIGTSGRYGMSTAQKRKMEAELRLLQKKGIVSFWQYEAATSHYHIEGAANLQQLLAKEAKKEAEKAKAAQKKAIQEKTPTKTQSLSKGGGISAPKTLKLDPTGNKTAAGIVTQSMLYTPNRKF